MIRIDTLFFTVVSRGKANAVLRKAHEYGASGGTIFLAEGTIQSSLLEKMGLDEAHKEILMISVTDELGDKLHEKLSNDFMFFKRNKGIAFSIPFKRWQSQAPDKRPGSSAVTIDEDSAHFCIVTIVDRGRAKDCIKAARSAGARGATLIRGHGAGVPADFYFPLVIEPKKDIVMIITTKDKAIAVRDRIFSELKLEKIGKGIVFILPVTKTSGIFETDTKASGR